YTSPLWVGLLTIASGIVGVVHVEWAAVGLGMALTLLGMATATVAAMLINGGPTRRDALLLPLGALAYAVLPPAWEFTTSGLETGLATGWLGTMFLLSVLLREGAPWRLGWLSPERAADAASVLAGLGVLVRPDFAIFSVAFLGLIHALAPPRTRRAL